MPLCETLGIEAGELTDRRVTLYLDWAPELCTADNVLHGGALMTLTDSAGGILAVLNLPAEAVGTTTIESWTSFLGAVTGGRVTAVARALHSGHRTIVVESELTNADRLVAKVTQTQLFT